MKSTQNPIKNQRGGAVLIVVGILAVIWILLIFLGTRGWGYPGYYSGRTHPPSFWYIGAPSYYSGPSVRHGSVGGPSHRGGGPSAGK